MDDQWVIEDYGGASMHVRRYTGQECNGSYNVSEVFNSFTDAKTALLERLRQDAAEYRRAIRNVVLLRKQDIA